MSLPNIDLGDTPAGTPPDASQQAQIRDAIGIVPENPMGTAVVTGSGTDDYVSRPSSAVLGITNKILASYDVGADHDGGKIEFRTSEDGITFSDPISSFTDGSLKLINSFVTTVTNTNDVHCIYSKWNPATLASVPYWRKSFDNAATWGSAVALPMNSAASRGANGGLINLYPVLLIPGYQTNTLGGSYGSGLWRTTDGGANWTWIDLITVGSTTQANECCMAVDSSGTVICYVRSDAATEAESLKYNLRQFRSTDQGATWLEYPRVSLSVDGLTLGMCNPQFTITPNGTYVMCARVSYSPNNARLQLLVSPDGINWSRWITSERYGSYVHGNPLVIGSQIYILQGRDITSGLSSQLVAQYFSLADLPIINATRGGRIGAARVSTGGAISRQLSDISTALLYLAPQTTAVGTVTTYTDDAATPKVLTGSGTTAVTPAINGFNRQRALTFPSSTSALAAASAAINNTLHTDTAWTASATMMVVGSTFLSLWTSNGASSGQKGIAIYADNTGSGVTGRLRAWVTNSGSVIDISIDNIFTAGTWFNATFTHDPTNNELRIYVDGALRKSVVYTSTGPGFGSGNSTSTPLIGAVAGLPCNGRIHQSVILPTCLTAVQVDDLVASLKF